MRMKSGRNLPLPERGDISEDKIALTPNFKNGFSSGSFADVGGGERFSSSSEGRRSFLNSGGEGEADPGGERVLSRPLPSRSAGSMCIPGKRAMNGCPYSPCIWRSRRRLSIKKGEAAAAAAAAAADTGGPVMDGARKSPW